MMKKTLLATAIAGAMVATGAQAATIYNQDGTKLDLYGNLQVAYKSVEVAQRNDAGEIVGAESADELFDNGSTIGFSGEHVISRGLTGYFKAEFEHDVDEAKTAGGLNTGDQAYMGLKGSFGDVRLGSWDPLIDDWIQDPITNNEFFDVSDSSFSRDLDAVRIVGIENREGNKLQYLSPSLSGFQFAVGTQYEGDAETENVSGSSNASAFGGLKYTAGAFSIAAAYDNLDNNDVSIGTVDVEAGDQYGITAQYTIDTLRLAAKVERFESDNDLSEDANFYALGARYGYGMGDIYGAYQYIDVGGDTFRNTLGDAISGDLETSETFNEVVIGATYNISDAMYTFVEGAWYDREKDASDGVAVGAVYLF
ncbi:MULTISPECIES: porin [unclassified Halomonas]|uniref:porin n=1 Tax=unclassified Halomonas TaxID=2609666 RepID=UPI002883DA1B|nr:MULTISPECIES: porin [unclassified Halomonas]MDT0501023.1 porin [Halomonas sp. PAR7]MDT0513214.1 porin [Halomonas sp. LES1]MDT0593017.1 porin [Halomonas sp. PAR8]